MDVRIANGEDQDQTASLQKQIDLGPGCLSRLFLQASSFQILDHLLFTYGTSNSLAPG